MKEGKQEATKEEKKDKKNEEKKEEDMPRTPKKMRIDHKAENN